MTDSIEAQGKTVKEAVSEGLLKMGARENEVKVTILEQPKTGLFGFLGGKPAKVLIEKKGPRGRTQRRSNQNDDHSGHGFGETTGGKKRGGKPQRRSSGGPAQGKQDNRAAAPRKEKGGDNASTGRSNDRVRGNAQPKGRQSDNRAPQAPAAQAGEGTATPRNTRARKPQNNRGPAQGGGRNQNQPRKNTPNTKTRNFDEAKQPISNENRSGRNMNRNRYQHTEGEMVLDKNNPHLDEQRKHFEAAERARRNEETGANGNVNPPSEGLEKSASPRRDSGRGRDNRNASSRNDSRRSDRNNTSRGGRDRSQNRDERPNSRDNRPSNPAPRQEPQVPDEILVQGLTGVKFAQALPSATLEEANVTLETVASGVFNRAGFPCRCEVLDDEYSLVKITTDDASAGMLIGRHGSTVDAIEHLVERMACNAVGERVRMNLDINNYRRRREEALVERVAEAVKTVFSTGRPYHIEPQDARERRMVHLEALKTEGLRTYTMYGAGGKHVVIALDDKPKKDAAPEGDAEEIQADSVDHGETPATEESATDFSDIAPEKIDPEENPAP